MDELERLLKDRREVVARIVHEVADAVRRDIISRAKRPTEHYKGAEHYADAIIAIISEPALLEVGRLRGALEGVIDDAGDAFVFSRVIHHGLTEPDLRAKQNDMAARINAAREALSPGERKEGVSGGRFHDLASQLHGEACADRGDNAS